MKNLEKIGKRGNIPENTHRVSQFGIVVQYVTVMVNFPRNIHNGVGRGHSGLWMSVAVLRCTPVTSTSSM